MSDHIIDISFEGNAPWPEDCVEIIMKTASAAIDEGYAYLSKNECSAEISIVLADDDFVQNLNHTYRQKDKPTNVLSFPQTEIDEFDEAQGLISLGDVIIAHGVITAEAKDQAKDFYDHLRHMLVHGTLHLMHFDHMDEEQAQEMETLEIAILKKMGINNPYDV